MVMSISAGSASASAWATQANSAPRQQFQKELKALSSALKSGDLTSAQQAFATISAANPTLSASSPLGLIGQALQTGNITAAQQVAQPWQGGQSAADTINSATSGGAMASTPLGQSILQLLNQSGITVPASGTNGSSSSPDTPDQSSQALNQFVQALVAALQAQQATTNGASANSGAAFGSPDSGAGGSGTTGSAGTINPLATGSPPPSAAMSNLQQSFQTLLSSLGASGDSNALSAFLQTLSSNVQNAGASGRFVSTHA